MAPSPTEQTHHSPPLHPTERPRGILKNSASFQGSPPTQSQPPTERPALGREMSEKEVTLQNTLQNMGHRRSSSNPRGPPSRRQSGATPPGPFDENSPRLKWDEANLYLTEQDRGDKMKIDEPKTPYAQQYDPTEDDDEIAAINASEVIVDELDKPKAGKAKRDDDIPGLDIGEAEMDPNTQETEDKRVIVDPTSGDADEGHHGEEPLNMPAEEREKHRQFEEARRKHYEMSNVKDLLGHSEDMMDEDDDDDKPRQPPPVPPLPSGITTNGQR